MKIEVNRTHKQTIKKIFLAGILLRLLVMPLFAHGDIIAVHQRVETIVCGSKTISDYSAVGTHLIESIFAIIFKPIIPCSMLSGIQQSFYDAPKLPRMLFFFKLPYLFFEIGFWVLMWKFIKEKSQLWQKKAAVFLAFNPIIIFSIYIFGRFEAYNLFFSALILYLLKIWDKKKLKLFEMIILALIMAFTISVRESYLFIFPAFFIALGGLNLQGILTTTLSGIFYCSIGLLRKGGSVSQLVSGKTSSLQSGMHTNYIFQGFIDTSQNRLLYLFFILMGIIFIWWLKNREEVIKKLSGPINFSLFSTLIFLSYYATSIYHPQYLSWFVPFFLILILEKESDFLLQSFYCIFPFFLLWLLSWGNHTTFGLLFPVSTAFKQIEPGWYLPIYDAFRWANIGKSILTGINLYWIFHLLKTYETKNN